MRVRSHLATTTLLLAASLGGIAACTVDASSSESGNSALTSQSYDWWRTERTVRQQEVDQFLLSNSDFRFFKDDPVGKSGIPVELLLLLPELTPEHFAAGDASDSPAYPFSQAGLVENPWSPGSKMPLGIGFTKGTKVLVPLPGLNKLRMQVTALTCAACHMGRVIGPDNKIHYLVGAPTTTFDPGGYRKLVTKSMLDERVTIESIKKAMHRHPVGSFYSNPKEPGQEMLERAVIDFKGKELVDGVRELTKDRWDRVQKYLIETAYSSRAEDNPVGHTPGRLDAFGVASTLVVDDAHKGEARTRAAMVDPPSIWRQSDRILGNWDGNQPNKVYRNVSAAYAVIGDATKLNGEIISHTVAFTNDLPSPPYPFDVDGPSAKRGQALFNRACASCHQANNSYIYPVDQVGTDPNRAKYALTPFLRTALITEVRKACTDPEVCEVPDDQIFREAGKDVGYVAAPLDGIWARAPYFHNGSVPTLYQVLVPSARAQSFVRGNIAYDQSQVGFVWNQEVNGTAIFDTLLEGNSNKGHDTPEYLGNIAWGREPAKLADLLEYLKTL